MTDCSTATTTPTLLRDISQVEPTEATVTDKSVTRAATDHSSKMTLARETRAALKGLQDETWPEPRYGPQKGKDEVTSPEYLESLDLLIVKRDVSAKWSKLRQQSLGH